MICSCYEHCSSSSSAVLPPLLQICPEIRNIILDDLLWSGAPLDSAKTSKSLWPAVLATCKQLNSEGMSILYSNTLTWKLGLDQSEPFLDTPMREWMWPSEFLQDKPCLAISSLMTNVSKISISIRWSPPMDSDGLTVQVRTVARILRRAAGWQHVTVEIRGEAVTKNIAIQLEDILRPLQYVRLKSIVLVGFKQTRAIRRLFKLITSTKCVIDIGLMYDDLWSYVLAVVDMNVHRQDEVEERFIEDITEKRCECQYARYDRDFNRFRMAREAALEVTACYILYRQQKVFKHDPEGWDQTLKLGPHLLEEDVCSD